ncbi:DEKNAAC104304 [Brettanomyces naardenensis]|uniref:DEKNAAC104304 n=1 Tax=Brettanomyces naardenensis TaxID=13370 RepID=A0A448YQM3_BRENA|nr:DEKNAAC104304 [Brettanomyces naardenensis]
MTISPSCGAVVGALACQRDSYLKKFASTVISCTEYIPPKETGGKKSKKGKKAKKEEQDKAVPQKLYEVELEDTILFPEGGGQPSDTGYLSVDGDGATDLHKITVKEVKREGLKAVHLITEPVEVGAHVSMGVDWDRRFDLMQQHTGQHLLSAVLDKRELPTLGWNLGDMINYVEIPRKLTSEELESVSKEVNGYITDSIPISVEIPDKESVSKNKMPDDYDLENGVLRVVHIGELDANPCCGTHLSSTSQIKGIALLNEGSGKGTNSRLNFLCGDRVIKYARESHALLRELIGSLTCQQETLPEKARTMVKENKKLQSRQSNLMREIASYKVKELKEELKEKDVVFSYRADGDLPYIFEIFKEMSPLEKGTVVLFTGELHESGAVIVFGEEVDKVVKGLKEKLSSLRGGGKDKFQGKVGRYEKGEIEGVLEYLAEERK